MRECGKEALLHPGQKDQRKLQPLGRVQRHQRHPRLGGVGVRIAHQRCVVEKLVQRLAALLCILRRVRQFLQVLNPREGLRRRLFFERADVAAAVVQKLDQLRQRRCIARLAECRLLLCRSPLHGICVASSRVAFAARLRSATSSTPPEQMD